MLAECYLRWQYCIWNKSFVECHTYFCGKIIHFYQKTYDNAIYESHSNWNWLNSYAIRHPWCSETFHITFQSMNMLISLYTEKAIQYIQVFDPNRYKAVSIQLRVLLSYPTHNGASFEHDCIAFVSFLKLLRKTKIQR